MPFGGDDLPVERVRAREPVPPSAEVVIVGAGVMGLSIAYNLASRGLSDIVIFEASYLAGGASGRNGGGIRQQWSTELNVRLMLESVEICKGFASELGVNVWFRQGGYLFLARTARSLERLEANAAIQQRLGLPTRMLSAAEAGEIVPELCLDGVLGACFNPSDGILFPWPFLWGYASRAAQLGARLYTFTPVTGIEKSGSELVVHSAGGSVRAKRVINAAGAWSPKIAAMLGIELPTRAIRHEICSSEPLKPFLGPMVSELSSGLYVSQSMRGEIVGGISLPVEKTTLSMGSTLGFLSHYATHLTRLMPILRDIKILRQWAGPYDVSPDGNPILGAAASVPEFYLACGFVGHGFMMAPIVGKLYAEWLLGGEPHEIFQRYTLSRFEHGGRGEKEDFNIG